MATAALQNDLTTCSICFEKFKTPRILPCSHVFCQSCISSYIVSSCESKEAPVGFSCPLCREFVPSPVADGQPGRWAESLPICEIIEKLVKLGDLKLCQPCYRDNEEEEAANMCVTCDEPICENCTKYHKRILTTRTHLIIPLNEPSRALQFIKSLNKNDRCPKHPNKEVELYCNQHRKPCCALCAGEEHRKCSDLETIKSAAENTKKVKVLKELREKINKFEQNLLTLKMRHEENLTEIENKSDSIKEETRRLRQEMNDHLDKIESAHMNELVDVTKKSRDMLNKRIDSVSDRIHFSRHCIQRLQNLEGASDACFMKEYHLVRESFKSLERQRIKGHELKLEINIPEELKVFGNLKHFYKIQVPQSELHLTRRKDVSKISLSLVYDFKLPWTIIHSGTLLSDGTILLANFNCPDIGFLMLRLRLNTCEIVKIIPSFDFFFDVLHIGNEFYVTNHSKSNVMVMSSDTFNMVREIKILTGFRPYGLAKWNDFIFVACESAILKYSLDGQLIRKYSVEDKTIYVTVTGLGHIVFSNAIKDTVTCINEAGRIQWVYKSSLLKNPQSVDRDEFDNLYVSGSGSNNILILSSNGELINYFELIPCPYFIKIWKDIGMCCVCSKKRKIKVFEIK